MSDAGGRSGETAEREAALARVLERSMPPRSGPPVRWWWSDDGRRVLVRRGEIAYRVPAEALDEPRNLLLQGFQVDQAAAERALVAADAALAGEKTPEEAAAEIAGARADAVALERDLGREFETARRVRQAIEEVAGIPGMLARGDRKGVLLAMLAAQTALDV